MRWGLTSFLYLPVFSTLNSLKYQNTLPGLLTGSEDSNGCLWNPRLCCQHPPSLHSHPVSGLENPGDTLHVHHSLGHGLSISFWKGITKGEGELGQQPFRAHSYAFRANHISTLRLLRPEIGLCVQWCSERASWAPGGHESSSGTSWPLIENAGTCKSSVCCVLLQAHRGMLP